MRNVYPPHSLFRRPRWHRALLLLVFAGLLFHPVIHHQVDEQCVVCLLGSGASPMPAIPLAPPTMPRTWLTWIAAPVGIHLIPIGHQWHRPPPRASPFSIA